MNFTTAEARNANNKRARVLVTMTLQEAINLRKDIKIKDSKYRITVKFWEGLEKKIKLLKHKGCKVDDNEKL